MEGSTSLLEFFQSCIYRQMVSLWRKLESVAQWIRPIIFD